MDIDYILDNPYVKGILSTFMLLYIATVRPDLPSYVKNLFNNPIFRIVVLFIIVTRANKDPTFSLIVAVTFVITLNFLSVQQAEEAFQVVRNSKKIENNQ
jgi:ABC-type nitrate/sulfonate/bicarbonate transport system permease component